MAPNFFLRAVLQDPKERPNPDPPFNRPGDNVWLWAAVRYLFAAMVGSLVTLVVIFAIGLYEGWLTLTP